MSVSIQGLGRNHWYIFHLLSWMFSDVKVLMLKLPRALNCFAVNYAVAHPYYMCLNSLYITGVVHVVQSRHGHLKIAVKRGNLSGE